MITNYHARYYAHALSKIGGSGVDRLGRALFDACVDLNPHQIEAALFAIRSPIIKGVLLADEVGLGKTIEAGLVLCQAWAEHRRRLLVICPASIRKQWSLELEEKFNLPTVILDKKSHRNFASAGGFSPFDTNGIVICSLNFASKKADEIRLVPWDLAVIDEAHKLRGAYRQSNKMGQSIRWALEDKKKILLTATPLQNSLIELYGLSTLADDRIFGEVSAFRSQYMNSTADLQSLRERLKTFTMRTLRSQVTAYVNYTKRKLITQSFKPNDLEHKLYESISEFLRKPDTFSLPVRQRSLTTMIIRKLLASSSKALAGTLETLKKRLIALREKSFKDASLAELIIEDEEIGDEILDEYFENSQDNDQVETACEGQPEEIDLEKLNAEIEELDRYINWANSIGIDTKTRSLLKALEIGFSRMNELNAPQKAVIFTESRRTQEFIQHFLESNGHFGSVISFNGTNRDKQSIDIYSRWLDKNKALGRSTGSRDVDIRTAIIEHFRDHARILVATEAAAEGVNLQFCSMVVNYDLPWNPQRIEQRIGRCHRYGQKHDVVVINFLNERNEADRRVYDLLSEKFKLFDDVFGSSNDVLGSLESGVDFERRVLEIYQLCRTDDEIKEAFDKLRIELEESIRSRIEDTRKILLEHFDEDVHARLKINLTGAKDQLDRVGRMFWALSQFMLDKKASFNDDELSFFLSESPIAEAQTGTYHLISKDRKNVTGEFLYRLSHPLGEHVINAGKNLPTPVSEVRFDLSSYPARMLVLEGLKGQTGWLLLQRLTIESLEHEEYLLFSGFTAEGGTIDQETCEKLFNCHAIVTETKISPAVLKCLEAEATRHADATIIKSAFKNNEHFKEAREQLEKWAEDMILAAENELRDTKEQLKLLNRQSRQAVTLNEQHELQEKIRETEIRQRRLRQRIFDVEDEIIEKRNRLIDALEKRMKQHTTTQKLFVIRWRVS